MKMFRIVFCALLAAMALTACQHDAPNATGAPTEEYMRAFIKEFGVPAEGHTFSMARSAGLQVKASRPTHITVTAVVDGEEYLFGDLSVPAGVTPIPVTIPSQVNTVNLTVYGYKYAVAADGIADLDNLPEPLSDPKSRVIDVKYSYNTKSTYFSETNPEGDPVLAFKMSELLKDYFDKYPQGVDQPEFRMQMPGEIAGHDTNAPIPYCDTSFGSYSSSSDDNYLVFPVYWRADRFDSDIRGELKFPFDPINKSSFFTLALDAFKGSIVATQNKTAEALASFDITGYPAIEECDPNSDQLLLSKGVRIHIGSDRQSLISLAIYGKIGSKWYYSNSCCYNNAQEWGDNYFPTDINHLPLCMGSTRRYYLDNNVFQVYEENKLQNIVGATPFLICFNAPPTKPNDTDVIRDYADAIYLVVPIEQLRIEILCNTPQTYKPYTWMILAEDLGGSFDWDFNDAVFEFTDIVENLVTENDHIKQNEYFFGGPTDATPVRKISVTPLAAGGTMPLYITYTGKVSVVPELPSSGPEDYYTVNEAIRRSLNAPKEGTWVIGTEIHKWMGASTHTKQLNTGYRVEHAPGEAISFAIPTDAKPGDTRFTPFNTFNQAWSSLNQPLAGFAVLVDKENTLNIDARTEGGVYELSTHTLGQGTYLIGKPDEDKDNVAPQMILVQGGGSDPFEWPREYVSLKDAYASVSRWIVGDAPVIGGKIMDKVTCRGDHEGQHPY